MDKENFAEQMFRRSRGGANLDDSREALAEKLFGALLGGSELDVSDLGDLIKPPDVIVTDAREHGLKCQIERLEGALRLYHEANKGLSEKLKNAEQTAEKRREEIEVHIRSIRALEKEMQALQEKYQFLEGMSNHQRESLNYLREKIIKTQVQLNDQPKKPTKSDLLTTINVIQGIIAGQQKPPA